MPHRKKTPLDCTPDGQPVKAQLQSVMGYQLAQAAVVADGVFDEIVRTSAGLRMLEYAALALVCESPGVGPLWLASALAVAAPSITNVIDRLAARQLVRRERNAEDGRSQSLWATEAGLRLKHELTVQIVERERVVMDALTPDEHGQLLALLHKLASARKTRRPGTARPRQPASAANGCGP